MMFQKVLVLVVIILSVAVAFSPPSGRRFGARVRGIGALHAVDQKGVVVSVSVPMDGGLDENDRTPALDVNFRPIFANSKFFVVTYGVREHVMVPFGLNVDKPPKNFPCPIVTKDGKGGELAGDVLRGTTSWSQGFDAAGATSDIMSFAGNVKWRKSVFDTTGAPWDNVVQALVSNTAERCKSVSLVFERELDEEAEGVVENTPVADTEF